MTETGAQQFTAELSDVGSVELKYRSLPSTSMEGFVFFYLCNLTLCCCMQKISFGKYYTELTWVICIR